MRHQTEAQGISPSRGRRPFHDASAELSRPTAGEITAAIAAANTRIDNYRGPSTLPDQVVVFTRDAVRGAVLAAPQPVTDAWVCYSLSVVARLTLGAHLAGVPLENQHVFARSQLTRYIHHDCARMATQSRAGYRSRLDVIAMALSPSRSDLPGSRPALSHLDVLHPYSAEDVQRLHGWSFSIHPAPRRERVQAIVALGLGCGLRRRDLVEVRGDSVHRDDSGVHVTVPTDGPFARTEAVTALATWENEIWSAAMSTGAGNLLVARHRQSLTMDALDKTIVYVNHAAPVAFNIRRLRNTWLATHLAAGTPLRVLMAAARLGTTQHLEDLLPMIPMPARDDSARALRGARS